MGKSILESYAWGRPVIASDLGSRRELVQHGVTGLLYPDGDREQLAHSIGFLFDRPDLIEKMGAAARSRVKANHDPDQHMERLLELYTRLTSAKKFLSFPAAPNPLARAAASASPSLGVAAWSPSTAALNPTTNKLATNWPAWGTKSPYIAAAISLLP